MKSYKDLVLTVYPDAIKVKITGQHLYDLQDALQRNVNFVGIYADEKYFAYGYANGKEEELWHRVWTRIQQDLERKLSV
jgi:hypothetical protein